MRLRVWTLMVATMDIALVLGTLRADPLWVAGLFPVLLVATCWAAFRENRAEAQGQRLSVGERVSAFLDAFLITALVLLIVGAVVGLA